MAINFGYGNIFDDQSEAIINPVNTVGVMGAGLALQFTINYPQMFLEYKKACQQGELQIGKMQFISVLNDRVMGGHQWVVNFPTKIHWRDKSQLHYISMGLFALVKNLTERNIRSVAIPAIGCGCGQLVWRDVKSLIITAFADSDITVNVYEPYA